MAKTSLIIGKTSFSINKNYIWPQLEIDRLSLMILMGYFWPVEHVLCIPTFNLVKIYITI